MTITLHVFPPSPRSFKVLLAAEHFKVPYEMKLVNLGTGEQKSDAHSRLNLNQRVPVLTDGDFALWESNAILEYLASLAADNVRKSSSGLLPLQQRRFAKLARLVATVPVFDLLAGSEPDALAPASLWHLTSGACGLRLVANTLFRRRRDHRRWLLPRPRIQDEPGNLAGRIPDESDPGVIFVVHGEFVSLLF